MSFDRGRPGSFLGRPTRIGLPYHGLVMDGKLTLPNASEIDYPQPPKGGLYAVRRPDWIAPGQTAEQDAYDAAMGFEWRDYALIVGRLRSDGAGQSMHLGGKALNGWIWFDAETKPWRVQVISFGGGDNAARQMTLRFSRFGTFGGVADLVDRTTAPFDIGQSIPQLIQHRPVLGGSLVDLEANSSNIRHKLIDVTPDGSRSLWCAFCLHYTSGVGGPGPFVERPVAFYEITIATDGTISGSLLKGRADCVGGLVVDPVPGYACDVSMLEMTFPETLYGECSIFSGDWTMTWSVAASSVSYVFDLARPTGSVGSLPALGRGYADKFGVGHLAAQTLTREYSAVVAGWYGAGGVAKFADVVIHWSRETSGSHSLAVGNNEYEESCTGATFSATDPIAFTFSSGSSEHTIAKVALRVDGSEMVVESRETTRVISMSGDGGYPYPPFTGFPAFSASGTTQAIIKKNGGVVSDTTDPWSLSASWHLGGSTWAHLFGPELIGAAPGAGILAGTSTLDQALSFLPAPISVGSEVERVTPAPWDETTIGLVAQRLAAEGGARHAFSNAWARGVMTGGATTYTPATNVDVTVTPYGAYQPVTGEWSGVVAEGTPPQRAWV